MLDACLGSHASAAGRNRNSRSGLRNGNKQTFVPGIASGWS